VRAASKELVSTFEFIHIESSATVPHSSLVFLLQMRLARRPSRRRHYIEIDWSTPESCRILYGTSKTAPELGTTSSPALIVPKLSESSAAVLPDLQILHLLPRSLHVCRVGDATPVIRATVPWLCEDRRGDANRA